MSLFPLSVQAVETKNSISFPFRIAAPSFVLPAGVAENSQFLAQYFDEIGLLFFEAEACLAYGDEDLPVSLASLPVSWHVHLPLDLDWKDGGKTAWSVVDALMHRVAFLKPRTWVLHPPSSPEVLLQFAAKVREAGVNPANILLENVDESDLIFLWDAIQESGFSVCLDLGHILAYNQHALLDLPHVWDIVRMLHVYAAESGKGKHKGLQFLESEGCEILRCMVNSFKGDTVTLEVFSEDIFPSLDCFGRWLVDWRSCP